MKADSDFSDDMRCMKAVFVRERNYDMDTAGLDDMNQQSGGSKAVSALARAGMPLQSLPPPHTHSHIAFGICNSSGWRDSMMAQKSADVCILAEKNDI